MSEDKNKTLKEFHKEIAVKLFNRVWDLLEKKDRTEEENYEMIHSAHTSLYHWLQIGTNQQSNVGEWQVSRVYSVLNMPESALFHAKKSLEYALDKENKLDPFFIAYSYEALARASAISDKEKDAKNYLKKAQEFTEQVEDKESKDMLLADLKTINA